MAARVSQTSQIQIENGRTIPVSTLLDKPEVAATSLSEVCMRVFKGENSARVLARTLDYLAYGVEFQKRSAELTIAIMKSAGDRQVMDVGDEIESD